MRVTDLPGFFEVLYDYDARGRLVRATGVEERVPSTEPRLHLRYDEVENRPSEIDLESSVPNTGPDLSAPSLNEVVRYSLEYDEAGALLPIRASPDRLEQLRWHLGMLRPSVKSGHEPWAPLLRLLVSSP